MKIYPNLTKEYIFERVTSKQIFEKYLKEEVIDGNMYFSPFRIGGENTPSASFRIDSSGNYRFSDFGRDIINIDCIEFVGTYHGLSTHTSMGFILTLHIIAKAFKIHHYSDGDDEAILDTIYDAELSNKRETEIYPITCDFTDFDNAYWNKINVDLTLRKQSYIFRAAFVFIKNNKHKDYHQIYHFSHTDPCYGYYLGTDKGRKIFELYFPYRTERKFIVNKSVTKGLATLGKAGKNKFVIATKSWKDKVSLSSFLYRGENLKSFALASESSGSVLTKKEIDYIKKLGYTTIYVLTDYDPAGLHSAWLHRKLYNCIPLFFKQETWNSNIKYATKDFSGNVLVKGIPFMQNLINNFKQHDSDK